MAQSVATNANLPVSIQTVYGATASDSALATYAVASADALVQAATASDAALLTYAVVANDVPGT
jgi:hypothetical protein